MANKIDKQTMLGLIVEAKRTDPETGSFAEWLAEYLAEHLPTLAPPNEWVSIENTTQESNECEYCCGEPMRPLDWQYGLDHIFPDYKYCPMCGRGVQK